MRKYGESKTIRIIMATVPHDTSGLGLRKFQTVGFLLTRVYVCIYIYIYIKYTHLPSPICECSANGAGKRSVQDLGGEET